MDLAIVCVFVLCVSLQDSQLQVDQHNADGTFPVKNKNLSIYLSIYIAGSSLVHSESKFLH